MGARGPKSAAELEATQTLPATKSARKLTHPAPAHLSAPTRDWWDAILADYDLEGHHRRLLQAACESWDRMQTARRAIGKYGLTFVDPKGCPRARPEVAIERDAKIGFARLVRELDLDTEPPPEGRRPPSLRSNRG